jgi:hypothetical protein
VHATLTITHDAGSDGAELAVAVEIANDGAVPVTVDTRWFPYPFLLHAHDDAGHEYRPMPPVPDDQHQPTTIAPGKSIRFEYRGLFSVKLPHGNYEIRFESGDAAKLTSPWVPFRVGG